MSSTASYINKKRVETIARNNKVEYPGKVAKNIEPVASTCNINPNFEVLDYKFKPHKCDNKKVVLVLNCDNQ